MLSRFAAAAVSLCLSCSAWAQTAGPEALDSVMSGRLVVVYRTTQIPGQADAIARSAGARVRSHLARLGMSVVETNRGEEAATARRLQAQPGVQAVLQDRLVTGHAMPIRVLPPLDTMDPPRPSYTAVRLSGVRAATPVTNSPLGRTGVKILSFPQNTADVSYKSPAGWAVRAAGGYGDGISGGPASGPWNISRGAGVRIAILDSGIDAQHPDLAPNVALNLSEIDQVALPSPCDDGSPADQQGHGTWVASLAAGALGNGTGEVVGVAPQATLLNIKVLERIPAAAGASVAAQCEAGQTGGLLSWVLQGINDAVAQHADVISLSLGTLVDLTTGDGAGWKASFDRATYAAAQAGAVIVAASGNDGMDLSTGRYVELPAQARDVLPVTASTNPDCAENLASAAACAPGPITRPYYSNYGAALNSVAAPGGSYPAGPDNAVSGWIRGACSSGIPNTADGLPAEGKSFGCFGLGHVTYVQAMGSSASAPLVAGAAAILHAAHPDWTAEKIIAVLRSTANTTPGMSEPILNLPAAIGAQ